MAGSLTVTDTFTPRHGRRVTALREQATLSPLWRQRQGADCFCSLAPAGSVSVSCGRPFQMPGPRLMNQRSKVQSWPGLHSPLVWIFSVCTSGAGRGGTRTGMQTVSFARFGSFGFIPPGMATQFCTPGRRLAGMRSVTTTRRIDIAPIVIRRGQRQVSRRPACLQVAGAVTDENVAPAGNVSVNCGTPVHTLGPRLMKRNSKLHSPPGRQNAERWILRICRSGAGGPAAEAARPPH